jgi:hypothetical protein
MNRLNRGFEEIDDALQELFSPITSVFGSIRRSKEAPSASKPAARLR